MISAHTTASDRLDLLDWRRQISELYTEIRSTGDPAAAWERWREVRDELFATHPQSPVPEADRASFTAVPCFDYDPGYRVPGIVSEAEPEHFEIAASGEDPAKTFGFTRFGTVGFELGDRPCSLDAFWLDGYGGGLFLPLRDRTSGKETYGAGRYLMDSVKGSDLGTFRDGHLVLDFNFAYNPSCSYDPRWVCPLAPPGNRVDVAVRAGERMPEAGA